MASGKHTFIWANYKSECHNFICVALNPLRGIFYKIQIPDAIYLFEKGSTYDKKTA
jgi:hypothetical protein